MYIMFSMLLPVTERFTQTFADILFMTVTTQQIHNSVLQLICFKTEFKLFDFTQMKVRLRFEVMHCSVLLLLFIFEVLQLVCTLWSLEGFSRDSGLDLWRASRGRLKDDDLTFWSYSYSNGLGMMSELGHVQQYRPNGFHTWAAAYRFLAWDTYRQHTTLLTYSKRSMFDSLV